MTPLRIKYESLAMYARQKIGQLKKIVILRALPFGDLLTAVPAFRALRSALPDARITLIALPGALDFVTRFGAYLDDFIAFPGFPGFPEQTPNVRFFPSFLNTVQKLNFDLAIQMQDSGTISNSLTSLLGARANAGFYQAGSYCPDEELFLPYPEGEPETERQLRLVEFLGFSRRGEQLEFPLLAADWKGLQPIKETFGLYKDYVCIQPGASGARTGWSTSQFAELADGLAALGYQVMLIGSPGNANLVHATANEMESKAIQLVEHVDMGVSAALLSQACLLVSNDMSTANLAAAVKTPSMVLASGADPDQAGALNGRLPEVIEYSPLLTASTVLSRAVKHLEKVQQHA
jgi:ADP-heptose:LPS heptosyltransferase